MTTKHGNVVTYREGIPLIKSGDPYYTFLVRGCDKINTLYLRLLKVYEIVLDKVAIYSERLSPLKSHVLFIT